MHRCVAIAVMLAATAAAQTPPPHDQPNPREKARELLEKAAPMLAGAQPHIHVIALMDLGATYHVFDKENAIFYLRNAFAATAAVPEEEGRNFRTRFQAEIAKRLAEVSITDACDLLRGMTEPGKDDGSGSAAKKVVDVLLARDKPEFDRAIEVVNLVPESAEYPFDAVERILQKLPAGDSRRVIVFGNALSAFKRRPAGTGFPHLLARYWKALPRENAQSAIGLVVNAISNRADDPNNNEAGFSITDEGRKQANSRKAKELHELIHVVRELDPKRAKELLLKYPELEEASKRSTEEPKATEGQPDDDGDEEFAMPLIPFKPSNPGGMEAELNHFRKVMDQAKDAQNAFAKDPEKAFSSAAEIPPRYRASLLATAAELASGKTPELGQRLLNECMKLLLDLKDPSDRALPWAKIGQAAHKLKNDELAIEALQHALEDIVAVYAEDTNTDLPNVALPEYWPSVQGCRMVIWIAVKALGVAAEPLLAGIHNDDLALLAHIEMGRALLDYKRRDWSIQWQHVSK